jgi:hypothetical protein
MRTSPVLALLILIASAISGCSSSTETVAVDERPSIRSFSRDTASPGYAVSVFGKNLAFSRVWIGDIEVRPYDSMYSNFVRFYVPGSAHTDYVYVSTDGSYKARSPKQLVIRPVDPIDTSSHDTADQQHFSVDRLSSPYGIIGKPLTIYGKQLLQKRDSLVVLLAGLFVPIDKYTDDSIVITIPHNASTGYLEVNGADRSYGYFYLQVSPEIAWRHCTISIIGYEYTDLHHRSGTGADGRHIDSQWTEHRTFSWTQSFPIKDPVAPITSGTGPRLDLDWQYLPGSLYSSSLRLGWSDTTCALGLTLRGHSSVVSDVVVTSDTSVSLYTESRPFVITPNKAQTILIPSVDISNPYFFLSRRETGRTGPLDVTETSTSSVPPFFGVGRVVIELTP